MASNPPPPLTQRFTGKAVGDGSLVGLAIPGNLIRGIVVDNYSASWLYIPQIIKYVPPYTVGYAIAVYPAQNTIDVTYQPGPLGLLSLNQGQPAIVLLSSDSVADSPGTTITTTPTSLQPLGVLNIPGGGNVSQAFALTPQQSTLVAYIVGNARDCILTVIGATTGIAYANDSAFGDTANPAIVQLAPQTDPVTNIGVNNPGLTPAIAYLFTYTGTVVSAAQIVNAVSARMQVFNPATTTYDDITSLDVGGSHGIGVALFALNPADGLAEALQQDGNGSLDIVQPARKATNQVGARHAAVLAGTIAIGTIAVAVQPAHIQRLLFGLTVHGTTIGSGIGQYIVQLNDTVTFYTLDWGLVEDGQPVNQNLSFVPSLDLSWRLDITKIWTLQLILTDYLGAPLTYDYSVAMDYGIG